MIHLYWSCPKASLEALLDSVSDSGLSADVVGSGNGYPVLEIASPNAPVLRHTAHLVASGRIKSAAVVSRRLGSDGFWLAAEWHGRMIFDRVASSASAQLSDLLRLVQEFEPQNLLIYEVAKPAPAVPADGKDVLENPSAFYGEFADPNVGGAVALFAAGFEAARQFGLPDDQVLVGRPKTFGFDIDEGEQSITAWCQSGVISVQAVGFSLARLDEQVQSMFDNVGVDQTDLHRDVGQWSDHGYRFGIALVIRGLEDPPVVIPTGSVFQQPSIGSSFQNLATAQAASAIVSAGATVPLVLPAYCLNPTFQPPSGPVTPTPLVHTLSGGTQEAVWERIRERYRGSR